MDNHPAGSLSIDDRCPALERPTDQANLDADLPFTDEQLTMFALAADIDQAIPDDAVPFDLHAQAYGDLLPDWYMPAPAARGGGGSRLISVVIVLSLLAVNALGLCVTYGSLEIAW